MSPQFHELAERETRKLNDAYEEAMATLRGGIASVADGTERSEPVQG
jgi:hypothetical protein